MIATYLDCYLLRDPEYSLDVAYLPQESTTFRFAF